MRKTLKKSKCNDRRLGVYGGCLARDLGRQPALGARLSSGNASKMPLSSRSESRKARAAAQSAVGSRSCTVTTPAWMARGGLAFRPVMQHSGCNTRNCATKHGPGAPGRCIHRLHTRRPHVSSLSFILHPPILHRAAAAPTRHVAAALRRRCHSPIATLRCRSRGGVRRGHFTPLKPALGSHKLHIRSWVRVPHGTAQHIGRPHRHSATAFTEGAPRCRVHAANRRAARHRIRGRPAASIAPRWSLLHTATRRQHAAAPSPAAHASRLRHHYHTLVHGQSYWLRKRRRPPRRACARACGALTLAATACPLCPRTHAGTQRASAAHALPTRLHAPGAASART